MVYVAFWSGAEKLSSWGEWDDPSLEKSCESAVLVTMQCIISCLFSSCIRIGYVKGERVKCALRRVLLCDSPAEVINMTDSWAVFDDWSPHSAMMLLNFAKLWTAMWHIGTTIVGVPILEKCYRGYGSAMKTLNYNLVFFNLIIDVTGWLWMLWYFNDIINLAPLASVTIAIEEWLWMLMYSYRF